MKKILFILTTLFLAITAYGADEEAGNKKEGFLTTKWCVERGYFRDCRLETHFCGEGGCFRNWEVGEPEKEELVLFVHDEGKYYNVKLSDKIARYELDEAISRNQVTIIGDFDEATNTITATEYKAPPPAGKSFFKGCL